MDNFKFSSFVTVAFQSKKGGTSASNMLLRRELAHKAHKDTLNNKKMHVFTPGKFADFSSMTHGIVSSHAIPRRL